MAAELNYIAENEINWNPWTGCHKVSDGCTYCMMRNAVYRNNKEFRLPIQKTRIKNKKHKVEKYEMQYKVPAGTVINVCSESDFFIEDADYMRNEAWDIIHERSECLFHITTKRPERIIQCLPDNWLLGWDNVLLSVSIEDNWSATYRLPILMEMYYKGFRHLGITVQPLLEDIDILSFIGSGYIEQVLLGGENYYGYRGLARPLDIAWVKKIKEQCEQFGVPFKFISTGTRLRLATGQIISIKWYDQAGMADFYKLSVLEGNDIAETWKSNAEELEKRKTIEEAHNAYKIVQRYLELEQKRECNNKRH